MEKDFVFFKNLTLIIVFLTLTPLLIGVSIFSLYTLNKTKETAKQIAYESVVKTPKSGVSVYASLPDNRPGVKGVAEAADARVEIIRQYLQRYKSPLLPHAETLVQAADQYGLDFRLVTAIAQQESNLCKRIPENTFNCWGWGIHSQGTLGFQSYEEGIWTVTQGVKENYVDRGYDTVEKIMSKYTPQSNGSWADGVSIFMAEMR